MSPEDKRYKILIELLTISSIMTIFLAYGHDYFPLVGLFISSPYVFLGVRNGINYNTIAMGLTGLLLALVFRNIRASIYLLMFIPHSLVLNYMIVKRRPAREILLIASLVFFVSMGFSIYMEGKIFNINITSQVESYYKDYVNMQVGGIDTDNMTRGDLIRLDNVRRSMLELTLAMVPSLLMVFSILVSYLNHLASCFFLSKIGYRAVNRPKLSHFSLPSNFNLGIIVMAASIWILGQLNMPYVNSLKVNIGFLVVVGFYAQGVASLVFIMAKKKINIIVRSLILVLSLLLLPLNIGVLILGVLDNIFNFRRLKKQTH